MQLPYPNAPVQPFDWPPDAVILSNGLGRLTVPANSAGVDCPLIPIADLPQPNTVLAVSPPYRLPGNQIAQAFALWLRGAYEKAYWWDPIEQPVYIPISLADAQNHFSVNYADHLIVIPLSLSPAVGWTQPPDATGEVGWSVGNIYWDENGIPDWDQWNSDWVCTCRDVDNMHYYEAVWAFYEIFTLSWAYCTAPPSGRRPPSILPSLCALAGLGLVGVSAGVIGNTLQGQTPGKRRKADKIS